MSTPRILRADTPGYQGAQETLVPPKPVRYSVTRDNLATRNPRLDDTPEGSAAADLEAEMLAGAHVVALKVGAKTITPAFRMASFRKPEDAVEYVRRQVRGEEHVATLDDVASWTRLCPEMGLALVAPILRLAARENRDALLRVLADIAPLAGFTLAPTGRASESAMSAAADVMAEAGATCAAVVRDATDGTIDDRAAHLENIRRLEEQLAELKASVTGGDVPEAQAGARNLDGGSHARSR